MTQSKKQPFLWLLALLSAALIGLAIWHAHLAATEIVMGLVQKLVYFHIGCAIATCLGFTTVLVCSILFLATRREKYDLAARAGASVGVMFCTLVLITGSIWAKGAWNTWWRWDEPRLFTSLVMWFIYLAYLMLNQANPGDRGRAARLCAVYGIASYLIVPAVYFAARIPSLQKTGLHPPKVDFDGDGMRLALRLCMITFTTLYALLFTLRLWAEQLSAQADGIRQRIDDIEDGRLLKEMTESLNES